MTPFELLLHRSLELSERIEGVSLEWETDSSDRGEVSLGACDLSLAHGVSLRILVGAEMHSSGVALLRLQFEALARATWVWHCASDGHVATLAQELSPPGEKAAKKLPSLREMIDELHRDGHLGPARLFARFHDRLSGGLNSFVHGGLHPLHRGRGGYPESLLMAVVKNSNGLCVLTLLQLAELTGVPSAVESFAAISEEFSDCCPDFERFPD